MESRPLGPFQSVADGLEEKVVDVTVTQRLVRDDGGDAHREGRRQSHLDAFFLVHGPAPRFSQSLSADTSLWTKVRPGIRRQRLLTSRMRSRAASRSSAWTMKPTETLILRRDSSSSMFSVLLAGPQ